MTYNYAKTVTGDVSQSNLGVTYVHEHLIVKPQLPDKKYFDYTLEDEGASKAEVDDFARVGGNTLVEMTPINYGRDVSAYKRIANATKVNIICCTGYHKELFMPEWVQEKSVLQLYDIIMDEIENGIDGTDIRPGVIKIGTSYNVITDKEHRAIEAAARAHLDSGVPISTHCDKGTMGVAQLKELTSYGVKPDNILLCHIDSALDFEYAKELCKEGAIICFDHVGRELADKDAVRVDMISRLVSEGLVSHLTLAGDMGKKNYLKAYGGKPGFSYILTDLKEELKKYVADDDLKKIFVENPGRFFAYRG